MIEKIEIKAINKLIVFYNLYIQEKNKEILKEKAEEIQTEFISLSSFFNNEVSKAIGKLVTCYVNTGIKQLTKEEAKKIVYQLEKRKKEIKDE